jgi:glycosyltransferase involved in cell wall biosynthesis
MLVKDEKPLLGPLLKHVMPYVGEAVIVDTGSSDGTDRLAMDMGARVIYQALRYDFAQARNAGLQVMQSRWIFMVDADEWPTQRLLDWLHEWVVRRITVEAMLIRRHNRLDGRDAGERTWEWHPRLFRNGLRFTRALHEYLPLRLYGRAPEDAILQHYKTRERQERQDRFYKEWGDAPYGDQTGRYR